MTDIDENESLSSQVKPVVSDIQMEDREVPLHDWGRCLKVYVL